MQCEVFLPLPIIFFFPWLSHPLFFGKNLFLANMYSIQTPRSSNQSRPHIFLPKYCALLSVITWRVPQFQSSKTRKWNSDIVFVISKHVTEKIWEDKKKLIVYQHRDTKIVFTLTQAIFSPMWADLFRSQWIKQSTEAVAVPADSVPLEKTVKLRLICDRLTSMGFPVPLDTLVVVSQCCSSTDHELESFVIDNWDKIETFKFFWEAIISMASILFISLAVSLCKPILSQPLLVLVDVSNFWNFSPAKLRVCGSSLEF